MSVMGSVCTGENARVHLRTYTWFNWKTVEAFWSTPNTPGPFPIARKRGSQ